MRNIFKKLINCGNVDDIRYDKIKIYLLTAKQINGSLELLLIFIIIVKNMKFISY